VLVPNSPDVLSAGFTADTNYTFNEIAIVATSHSGRKYLLAHTVLSTPLNVTVNETVYITVVLGLLLKIPMMWYLYRYSATQYYDGDFLFYLQIANASRSRVVTLCFYRFDNSFGNWWTDWGIRVITRFPGYALWLNKTALYIYATPSLPDDIYSRLDVDFTWITTTGSLYHRIYKLTDFQPTRPTAVAGVRTMLIGLLAVAR